MPLSDVAMNLMIQKTEQYDNSYGLIYKTLSLVISTPTWSLETSPMEKGQWVPSCLPWRHGAPAANRLALTWSSSSVDLHFIPNPGLLWMRDTFSPSVITVNYSCLLSIFSCLHKLILCQWILSCVSMPWFIIAIVKTICYETVRTFKNVFCISKNK